MPFVYILKCADDSYYTGSTGDLERRMVQHQTGYFKKNYTSSRLPVELVWSHEFPTMHDAFVCERQIKGWTRAKKEALIRGDFDAIHVIVKNERKRREAKHRKPEAS
jgi:predicted GIY-YIG superfamily endonuclease